MDPYRLLSRSTNLSRNATTANTVHSTPSSGPKRQPQLSPIAYQDNGRVEQISKKRKRGQDEPNETTVLDFFGARTSNASGTSQSHTTTTTKGSDRTLDSSLEKTLPHDAAHIASEMSTEEVVSIWKKHKLKATWLNPSVQQRRGQIGGKGHKVKKEAKAAKTTLHPKPLQAFAELHARFGISARLVSNIEEQGYVTPSEVQLGALPLLLDDLAQVVEPGQSAEGTSRCRGTDLLTVAPTGSGKTLAFMIPLIHRICNARRETEQKSSSAIILAPTKELAGQIVNEGRKLSRSIGVRFTQVRKGMRLYGRSYSEALSDREPDVKEHLTVKSDILVSTPGALMAALTLAKDHDERALDSIRYLILDEADVLLDPLFREQTLAIWNSLTRSDLRVSLWSATMGSNIEELARLTINERLIRISRDCGQDIEEAFLVRLVVGLKDSAIPNVQHKLVYAASEQGKLMGLRQLLHPTMTSSDTGPPLLPPFLVFTQTIERAVALHSELLYDIPAEAGGISRIAVLHSDLSDTARDSVMTKFRRGEIWVLITTDLLSRGVDFRGVNGIVNYDIPTSSAAYVHRVGRTGRAGRDGGIALTMYTKEDIPYLKPIANLVATAQKIKGTSEKDGVQSWLLDSLPSVSKKAKKGLKKRGVESRSARGREKDPKAARKARISTKAGFVRQEENNRKGVILGSRNRREAKPLEDAEETDFGGFD